VGASFEVVDPPPEISLLSLACGWPPGANGSPRGASRTLGLKILRVQGRGGEPTSGVGRAGRPGPTGPGPPRPGVDGEIPSIQP
jgi:hypothetical protein